MNRRRFFQAGAAGLAAPLIAGAPAEASIDLPVSKMLYERSACYLDYNATLRCWRNRAHFTFTSDDIAHNPWLFAAIGAPNETWFFGAAPGAIVLEYLRSAIEASKPRGGKVAVTQRLDLTIRPTAGQEQERIPWMLSHPTDIRIEPHDRSTPIAQLTLVFPAIVHQTPQPTWFRLDGGEFVEPGAGE